MNLIEFQNVSKSFFTQKLYKKVNLEINSGDKIALTGHNGTGKSTFIKLITGEEDPDYGQVIINEEISFSCFDQFGRVDQNMKVEDLLNIPFEDVIATQTELELISAQFSDDAKENEAIMEKYALVSDKFESLGGYSYIHIQSEFIDVFGIGDKLGKKFRELSGGEKQYIRLAMTLFSNSDLIILDEPLSYFDKKKTAWLSSYISESTKAFVVVSHNVDFIRGIANKILDIDNKTITAYECDYRNFLKEKKLKLSEERKQNQKTDLVIEETQLSVHRKVKLLEKVDNKHAHAVILRRMRRELKKLEKQKIEFSPEYKYEYAAAPEDFFTKNRDIGENMVTLSRVSKEFPDKFLYKDADLEILKDSKICIVGENGSGKSTLLRILAGKETPTSGMVEINEKAKISFIEQETVLENEQLFIKDYLKEKTGLSDDFIEAAIDSLYNHDPEFRDKKLYMLSGGEKKRLEIFAHILSETDVLIIDEPSTYMDDYSRNTIANMLLEYPGAVIMVTHDKALLRKIDFQLYDIRDNRFRIKEQGNKAV
ncbi:ATP-binding cassette domain-containing protein [uncultured Ilyobacter sp.]|uniref:ABC-F family ATP-binding cassette domain-containing protein n=1 Tax=uncultured Ilyobacter sp. TaxID=544433 RepID=UPI002AA70C7B|nr:ATP-binding cassette domain-containing protein [uncultured Ilyobacter sp.]